MANERLTYLLELARQRRAGTEDYDELLGLIRSDEGGEVVGQIADFHAPPILQEREILSEAERNAIFASIMQADKLPAEAKVTVVPVHRVHFLRRSRWWVAAAAIILIATGTYLFVKKETEANTTVAQKPADLPPGHYGAILTLADKRTIVLDSAADGKLAKQGGTQIVKSNGQITYETTNTIKEVVLYNTMQTPRGRQFQLVLPDGSKVWLNAASSIRYPTAFVGNERKVEITGEAYFEVTKDAAKPFIVVTDEASVTVLGTHFDVMAYNEEPSIQTTLLEGLVKVSPLRGGQDVTINPGQEALVNRASGNIQVDKADTVVAVAWLRGQLSMENVDIQSLMRQVSRWYDVDVEFEGKMPDKKFFGMIDRNVYLSNILSVLDANGFQTKLEGNKITVSAK